MHCTFQWSRENLNTSVYPFNYRKYIGLQKIHLKQCSFHLLQILHVQSPKWRVNSFTCYSVKQEKLILQIQKPTLFEAYVTPPMSNLFHVRRAMLKNNKWKCVLDIVVFVCTLIKKKRDELSVYRTFIWYLNIFEYAYINFFKGLLPDIIWTILNTSQILCGDIYYCLVSDKQ